jgi:uncharacterized protein with NAD-binding domain and iron-sulfur cluster
MAREISTEERPADNPGSVSDRGKTKIAILGGGVGAMTAAFYLTSDPKWQDSYEITVYQLGWRLGGKAASGRNLEQRLGHRIEEHGFHVLFGFYHNAFRLIRDCYGNVNPADPHPTDAWKKAFRRQDDVVYQEMSPAPKLANPEDGAKLEVLRELIAQANVEDLFGIFSEAELQGLAAIIEPRDLEDVQRVVERAISSGDSQVRIHAKYQVAGTVLRIAQRLEQADAAAHAAPELWTCHFPRNGRSPGESGLKLSPTMSLQLLLDTVNQIVDTHRRQIRVEGSRRMSQDDDVVRAAAELLIDVGHVAADTLFATAYEVSQRLERRFGRSFAGGSSTDTLGEFAATVRRKLEDALKNRTQRDGFARHVWIQIDLWTTVATGIVADGLLFFGFDVIDDLDFREWLAKHGASAETIASPWVRSLYDALFGFRRGDVSEARVAAGIALRGLLYLVWGYNGSLAWRFNGGTGDVIFAPLYKVLKDRGVKFEFFRRVRKLIPSLREDENPDERKWDPGVGDELPDRDNARSLPDPFIDKIVIEKQLAKEVERRIPKDKLGNFTPLIPVKVGAKAVPYIAVKAGEGEQLCWPAAPVDEYGRRLLPEGDESELEICNPAGAPGRIPRGGTFTLHRGVHFDHVVLGISVGGLDEICRPLIDRKGNANWKAMFANNDPGVVATQSWQVWLKESGKQMGWPDLDGHSNKLTTVLAKSSANPTSTGDATELPVGPIVTSGDEPLASWVDMSHLLDFEDWPDTPEKPNALAYLAGVIPVDKAKRPPYTSSPNRPKMPVLAALGDVKDDVKVRVLREWLQKAVMSDSISGDQLNDLELLSAPAPETPENLPTDVHPGEPVVAGGSQDYRPPDPASEPPPTNGTGGNGSQPPSPPTATSDAPDATSRACAQYVRVNREGTELYTLSEPGKTKFRLRSDDSGFQNLFLAGDWTYTGLNAGCFEAAVMSGMRAARAICGRPQIIVGEDGN